MISRCSGEYFIAFDSRFSSACSAASASSLTAIGVCGAWTDTENGLWRNWLSSESTTRRTTEARSVESQFRHNQFSVSLHAPQTPIAVKLDAEAAEQAR